MIPWILRVFHCWPAFIGSLLVLALTVTLMTYAVVTYEPRVRVSIEEERVCAEEKSFWGTSLRRVCW